jgi:DNA mismatch repair protein MutS
MLEANRPNYLAALVITNDSSSYGFAYCDITTGEFFATQLNGAIELEREMARVRPSELLMADGAIYNSSSKALITRLPSYRFESSNARQTLLAQFKVSTLAGFDIEDKPLALRAAGAILSYLRETQPAALNQLMELRVYSTAQFMGLDDTTRRNLELIEPLRAHTRAHTPPTLLGVLDQTQTSMGARLLRNWIAQPLVVRADIETRLARVRAIFEDALLRAQLRESLKHMPDLERLTARVLSGIATPKDLLSLRTAVDRACAIFEIEATRVKNLIEPSVADSANALQANVSTLIERAIKDSADEDGFIKPGYNVELDGIHFAVKDAKSWVANLERVERERTGIKSLKVGYNKVFGYYIEITHANANAAPTNYIRKQTMTNAERYITPELKEHETLILNADERVVELEKKLLAELNSTLAEHGRELLNAAQAIARLDVATALADVAVRNQFTQPTFNDQNIISIQDGRHAVIERLMTDTPYTPNDTHMDGDAQILIITGPNMSGKSSYMRQVALIALMAQIGSFVPARAASLPIVDRIFTRIGAQDELTAGQSTFMVEMVETANILRHCTSRSLVILDEIGRGTSTYDGLAIAWSVIEYLHNHPEHRAKTLFATHYHELIALADTLAHVRNYNVAVSEENGAIVFQHKVVEGGADRSYGVHVAELAGLPSGVVNRARTLLRELENTPATSPIHDHTPTTQTAQLQLFGEESAALKRLRALDPNTLSPIEALTQLFELKKMADE